ncbi:MAG: HEAT repeat domain-containing protein [Planctomycetes bacterium]|nr:HEAT repeat domain-containing protein [Planctomycetota bacterium]
MVTFALRAGCALLAVGVVLAQDPEPPVDPTLPARLKELKSMVGDKKMAEDLRAVGLIQSLVREPEKLNPKDRTGLAKALGDVFRTGKVRPPGEDHVYREAGTALGRLDKDGSKFLARALAEKRIADNVPLQAHLIEALGRTKDDKQVDWLLEQAVRSPHDELRAAAGSALGEFTELDIKPRREVVKSMIREWGALHSKATEATSNDPNAPVDFGPENARKTLRAIETRWRKTLTRLTGQTMTNFLDWQHWLNKNQRWEPPAPRK